MLDRTGGRPCVSLKPLPPKTLLPASCSPKAEFLNGNPQLK